MKNVWITLLQKSEDNAQKIMSQLKTYGLNAGGHFWTDELEKMSWMGPRQEIINKDTALWLIVGSAHDFAAESIRYGLALLAITVQAQKGHGFPIVILYTDTKTPDAKTLPTPLREAQVIAESAAYAAKLVAIANSPVKPVAAEYRLDIYGIPGLGQWFETGPAKGAWKGAMFGVSGGGIDAHGVGAMGKLPGEKMILNYPQQGLKIKLGDKEYTAWAVQNELNDSSSYFVRALQYPDSILFGPYASDDEAEVFTVRLK